MTNPHRNPIRRNRGTIGQGTLAMPANGLDQFRLRARAESLDSQENDGGTAISGKCEVSMKVVVQSYTDTILISSDFQNIGVVGFRHSDFHYVNSVEGSFSKERRGTRRKTLVEKDGYHATRSMLRLSSSTLTAA